MLPEMLVKEIDKTPTLLGNGKQPLLNIANEYKELDLEEVGLTSVIAHLLLAYGVVFDIRSIRIQLLEMKGCSQEQFSR